MATQTLVAEFTAEEGPISVEFDTPPGDYGISPGGFINTTSGSGYVSGTVVWCDEPVDGGATSTVNVYAAGPVTGYVTLVITDIA